MVTTVKSSLTLAEFLQQPETEPASEFIDGKIRQKPVPQGQHSVIQSELVSTINKVTKKEKIAYAFPELRCNVEGSSVVPDVVVFSWSRIPLTDEGKIANRVDKYPDWCIEIVSPKQNLTLLFDKLLFLSQLGTKLGWLINPKDEVIFVIYPEQKLRLFRKDDVLPVLENIDLELTVNDVFDWLKF